MYILSTSGSVTAAKNAIIPEKNFATQKRPAHDVRTTCTSADEDRRVARVSVVGTITICVHHSSPRTPP